MAKLPVATWWRPGTVLYALFVVALISVPSDTGLGTPFGVISPSRVLLVVALAVVGVETIRGHEGRVVPGIGLLVAWLLFLGLAMASTATGAFGPRWSRLASLVLEGFGVFWLSWMIAQRSAARAQMVIVFATAAVAALSTTLAVLGFRFSTLFDGSSGQGDIRFGLVRQQASFDAPLFYSVWLVTAGALAAGIALSTSGRTRKLASAAWVMIAVGVITTASRFGLVAAPALLGVMFLAAHRPRPAIPALVVAAAVAVVFFTGPGGLSDPGSLSPVGPVPSEVASSAPPGQNPGGGTASPGAQSLQPAPTPLDPQAASLRDSTHARVEALTAAVDALRARPLLGWGLLSAKRVALAELGHQNFIDNTYLVIVMEQGLLGFAAFAMLILMSLAAMLPVRGVLAVSQILAFGAMLAFGAVAAILATSQGYAMLWLLGGLAVAGAHRESHKRRRSSGP